LCQTSLEGTAENNQQHARTSNIQSLLIPTLYFLNQLYGSKLQHSMKYPKKAFEKVCLSSMATGMPGYAWQVHTTQDKLLDRNKISNMDQR